ncbi:MAG: aryl-sulfate sulfotransferase [Chloroflexi bacterium]|nr:aryl-sulfate sulfotransferase [Chloroflexota bacterium]
MGWSQHHPVGLIYSAPQHCFRGYTLTTNNRDHHARLIDLEGRVCHQWQSDQGIGYAYLLPNGNLLLRTRPPEDAGRAETKGGSSGAILELDWDSNVVWEYRNPYLHHDYERLPNGNTLVLLFELLSPELTAAIQGGRPTDEDPEQMFGDVVKEIAPDGMVVYEWKSWEHLSPEEDSICPLEDRKEWPHGNSLNVTPEADLIVSYRGTSTVGSVDKASGEFRWKWGRGEIDHQHHPTWLDNGRVLIFDNGFHRPRSSYSRVIEVDPSTNEIAWEYWGNPAISFYSQAISSCERLPNGNTLICEGSPGRIFEVTPHKEIVWEYVNPHFHPGPMNALVNSVFRARHYRPEEVPALG